MGRLRVDVVFARASHQDIVALELATGSVVQDAVEASGLPERYGLAAGSLRMGLGGAPVAPDRPLRDGDRIEILRPLAMAPQDIRRRRARRRR